MNVVETAPALCSPQLTVHLASAVEAPRSRLDLHCHGDEDRAEIERFIADVYRRHFSARLSHFMPVLVSRSIDDSVCAAAGYRSAAQPLFLERYLPMPTERMLSQAAGRPVVRESIVEVGQFASRRAGEGRRLMRDLARHLVDCGFRWVVITATAELRRLLRYQGLDALPLAAAQRHCLGEEGRRWGSYYRHAPKVLAGDLVASLAQLERGRR